MTKAALIGSPNSSAIMVKTTVVASTCASAEAEDRAAHRAQARRLQFQADDEQQQHDAELGDVHHTFAVIDHSPSPRGRSITPAAR